MGKQVAIFQNVFLFFVAAHVAEIEPAALPTVQTFSEAVGCGRPDRGAFGTDGTIGWRAALRPAPTAGVLGVDCLDDICNDFSRASAVCGGGFWLHHQPPAPYVESATFRECQTLSIA